MSGAASELQVALVRLYGQRLRELRADSDAVAWGGLVHEAALDVLGEDATPEQIDGLLAAARTSE